ncbi:MAG: PAS domain S-box protein, partial [Desulfobacteraceae bacterium]|nr:PAS domain S-box protein [Desulfobacteraceae bacterium]
MDYRFIFDNIGDAVYVSEVTEEGGVGRIIEVNEIACHRYGYTKEEFLQLSVYDLNADHDGVRHVANKARAEGKLTVERTHIRRNGERFPVEEKIHFVASGGRPIYLSVCREVTERRGREEALRRAAQGLRWGRLKLLLENTAGGGRLGRSGCSGLHAP